MARQALAGMFTAAQGGSAKSAVLPYPQAPDLAPSFANTGTPSTENQVSKLFLGVGLVRNLDTHNFKSASIRQFNYSSRYTISKARIALETKDACIFNLDVRQCSAGPTS